MRLAAMPTRRQASRRADPWSRQVIACVAIASARDLTAPLAMTSTSREKPNVKSILHSRVDGSWVNARCARAARQRVGAVVFVEQVRGPRVRRADRINASQVRSSAASCTRAAEGPRFLWASRSLTSVDFAPGLVARCGRATRRAHCASRAGPHPGPSGSRRRATERSGRVLQLVYPCKDATIFASRAPERLPRPR